MKYEEVKMFARKMRNNPTAAEALLWQHIRGRKLCERRFLRQHPILYQFNDKEYFYFIPDFYCYKEKLIVELDGPCHDYQVEKDSKRQEILESAGYKVIRFKNEDLNNLEQVLCTIKSNFTK